MAAVQHGKYANITHTQKRRHDGGVMMQPICPACLRKKTC
jgi:hypothetical protein